MLRREKFYQFLMFPKERWDVLLGEEDPPFWQLRNLASRSLFFVFAALEITTALEFISLNLSQCRNSHWRF